MTVRNISLLNLGELFREARANRPITPQKLHAVTPTLQAMADFLAPRVERTSLTVSDLKSVQSEEVIQGVQRFRALAVTENVHNRENLVACLAVDTELLEGSLLTAAFHVFPDPVTQTIMQNLRVLQEDYLVSELIQLLRRNGDEPVANTLSEWWLASVERSSSPNPSPSPAVMITMNLQWKGFQGEVQALLKAHRDDTLPGDSASDMTERFLAEVRRLQAKWEPLCRELKALRVGQERFSPQGQTVFDIYASTISDYFELLWTAEGIHIGIDALERTSSVTMFAEVSAPIDPKRSS